MTEYRKPSFGKDRENHIMGQLGGIDPSIGLREYISNCIDNVYLGYVPSVKVNLHVDKKNRKIIVVDNGRGMNKNSLDHIIDNVGDSLKRFDDESIGEKGFGMLSFYGMGKEAGIVVYSRDASTIPPKINMLHWRRDTFEANATETVEPDRNPILPGLRTGTKVIISKILPQNFDKSFSPSKIFNKISEQYHPLLEAGKVEISLKYTGEREKEEKIKPLQFRGDLVVKETLPFEFIDEETSKNREGSVDVFLWYDPKNVNGKIRLYNKGVFVKNITGLEQFTQFPWDSGRLDGYINENFLKLTVHRNDYHPMPTFFDFTNLVDGKFSEPLTSRIRSGEENVRATEAVDLGSKLMKGLQDTYKELCTDFNISSGRFVKDKKGELKDVSSTGNETTGGGGRGNESIVDTDGGVNDKSGNGKKEEFEERECKEKRRVKPARNNLPQFALRLTNFSEEDRDLRSRLDMGFERVEINRLHPDYVEVSSDHVKTESYYNERMCDETAGFVFHKLVEEEKMSPLEASIFSRKLREEGYYAGLKKIKKNK